MLRRESQYKDPMAQELRDKCEELIREKGELGFVGTYITGKAAIKQNKISFILDVLKDYKKNQDTKSLRDCLLEAKEAKPDAYEAAMAGYRRHEVYDLVQKILNSGQEQEEIAKPGM